MPFPTPVVEVQPSTRASNGRRGEDTLLTNNTIPSRSTMARKSSAIGSLLLAARRDGALVLGCSHNSGAPCRTRKDRAEELVELVVAQEQAHALVAASALAQGQGKAKAAPTLLA